MTFALTVMGEVLKGPRVHHHFQTPTCFSPFLLGSPQSQLHTLFQSVVLTQICQFACTALTSDWAAGMLIATLLNQP